MIRFHSFPWHRSKLVSSGFEVGSFDIEYLRDLKWAEITILVGCLGFVGCQPLPAFFNNYVFEQGCLHIVSSGEGSRGNILTKGGDYGIFSLAFGLFKDISCQKKGSSQTKLQVIRNIPQGICSLVALEISLVGLKFLLNSPFSVLFLFQRISWNQNIGYSPSLDPPLPGDLGSQATSAHWGHPVHPPGYGPAAKRF